MSINNDLFYILNILIYPSMREIIDFIKLNKLKTYCKKLRKYKYHNFIYHIKKLEEKKHIIKLECESGYKYRYTVNHDIKKYENIFNTVFTFHEKNNMSEYTYKIYKEYVIIDFKNIGNKSFSNEGPLTLINDKNNYRYYILFNNKFVSVISKFNKENPRLPGLLYGKLKSEYCRCIEILKKDNIINDEIFIDGYRNIIKEV